MANKSQQAFLQAQNVIPGGVNSPVRSFQAVGNTPPFIESGRGAYLTDIDGHTYLDFCQSWGATILGHAHPAVSSAVQKAVAKGTSFGAPTLLETKLAQLIVQAMPSIELIRFVNSGTEATMSAVRLARAFTGRAKIIKFEGCYHGHADSLLATDNIDLINIPYNDFEAVEKIFINYRGAIAAVIVEPIAGNMGMVLPRTGFLEFLRRITRDNQTLLIFDEVITGFRVGLGGAQAYYGISPDVTCLGKIIGGGFPVGAYGGRKDIMQLVAPLGPVYQAGTLSGNPVAMTAGIVTLETLTQKDFYTKLRLQAEKILAILSAYLQEKIAEYGRFYINDLASMFTVFFSSQPIQSLADANQADGRAFAKFHAQMLAKGIYFSPSPLEANFISGEHSETALAGLL